MTQVKVNPPQWTSIHFENVSDSETFAYSLILVQGLVSVTHDTESPLFVYQIKNCTSLLKMKIRLRGGRFATVLHLDQGKNEFRFCVDDYESRRTFFYRPADTEYVVMPMYIRCKTENDEHLEDDFILSLPDVCDRIALGCRFVQTIIAETLHQSGFDRNTFALEQNDQNGNGSTVVFDSELRWNAVSEMTSEKLWEHLGREIMTSKYGRKSRKFLAFLSLNSKKEYSQHLAIGGGGLALCDAKYIRTWPATLDDFYSSFNSKNNTFTSLIENSFSASLGAVCHELCHTFDLGHTIDGVMGRDFDRVGTLFTEVERVKDVTTNAPNFDCIRNRNDSLIVGEGAIRRKLNINFSVSDSRNANLPCDTDEQSREQRLLRRCANTNETFHKDGFWFGGCANLLAYHRWINRSWERKARNEEFVNYIHYDRVRCIVTSIHGIVIVQLHNSEGYILKYWEFCVKRKKKLFLVPICYVRRSSTIVIEDFEGNLLKQDIECKF